MIGEPYRSPAPSPSSETAEEVVDTATRLGLLRSVHRPPAAWRALLPALLLPVTVIASSWGRWGRCEPPVLYVGLGFSLVIFAFLGWGPLRRRGLRLEIHAHGLVVVMPRKTETIIFEDIDELWYELNVHSLGMGKVARIVAVRLVDHARVEHHVPLGVTDAPTAIQWICKHVSDRLFADAQAALRASEALTFGDVRLDREGIAFGKDAAVAWSDIRLVRMQPGSIALFKRVPVLPWRTIRLDRVPHPTLFVRIFRELAARVEIDDPLASPPG